MANQTINVLQSKAATVVYKDAGGNVIPAGGRITWSVDPANAVSFNSIDDAAQNIIVVGQTAGTCTISAKEPVSGFTATVQIDVLAIQMNITQATIVLT